MRKAFLLAVLMLPLLPATALAGFTVLSGSIAPTSFTASGPPGFSASVSKTVTIFATEGPGIPSIEPLVNGFIQYSDVTLDFSEVPDGITWQCPECGTYTENYDTLDENVFLFQVTFTDEADGDFPPFNIYAVATMVNDSGIPIRFATELDHITVVTPAPEPATLLLVGSGLAGLGTLAWRRRR